MKYSPMLVQEGRGEKACTSAHGAVAAATAAPEWCSKNLSGSTKVSIYLFSASYFKLHPFIYFVLTSSFIIYFLKDIASSSGPGKLDMVIRFESQKGGVGKACTKVVAAPPESCLKDFSGLIKVYISTLSTSYMTLFSFSMTGCLIIVYFLKGTALLSDPEKLDVVISSGSQKGLDRTIIQNEDIMQRAASFG